MRIKAFSLAEKNGIEESGRDVREFFSFSERLTRTSVMSTEKSGPISFYEEIIELTCRHGCLSSPLFQVNDKDRVYGIKKALRYDVSVTHQHVFKVALVILSRLQSRVHS